MYYKTLDGKEIKWDYKTIDKEKISKPHQEARKSLKKKYPTLLILEEVQIQVKKGKFLYLDFYIPLLKIAIEVQGEQHEKYVPFFHKNSLNFVKGKINDLLKKQWAELNNIKLIRLKDEESEKI